MKDRDYYIQYILSHKLIFLIIFFITSSYFYRFYNYVYVKKIYYFVNVYNVKMQKSKVIFFSENKKYEIILPQILNLKNNCNSCCDEFFEKMNFYFTEKVKYANNIDVKILQKFFLKKDFGMIYFDGKNVLDILNDKFNILKIEDLNDLCHLI
jgi:hypothetical protein